MSKYQNVSNNPRFGRPLIPYFIEHDQTSTEPVINEGLTLPEEHEQFQREIVVPKGQNSIKVREFKDGYFEYKDISLENITDFNNVIKYSDGTPNNYTPGKKPTTVVNHVEQQQQLMQPLDAKNSASPGKRGKRRGLSSYKEHFENYDKMVINNTNTIQPEYPGVRPPAPSVIDFSDSFNENDYKPKDSDIVKKLFTNNVPQKNTPAVSSSSTITTTTTNMTSDATQTLLSPQFFKLNNQVHPSQPATQKSSIQDFIISVQKQKEPQPALKHSGSTSDVTSLQTQQQPYHQYHQLFHPESHQVYHHNLQQRVSPIVPDATYQAPRSYSPPVYMDMYTPPGHHHQQQHHHHHQHYPQHQFVPPPPSQHHQHHAHPPPPAPPSLHYSHHVPKPYEEPMMSNNNYVPAESNNAPLTEAEILAQIIPQNNGHNVKKDVQDKKNEKYAGGMWTSSPPPSSLPVPKFKISK